MTGGADGSGSVHQGGFEYHIANETGALVVWLEHRYYGLSYPVPDLSTDNLRFLSMAEALEDTANFIRNFKLPKANRQNVTNPASVKYHKTPWFLYSWSYPGALVAWMRGKYPDLVWGSIASSATIAHTTERDGQLYVTAASKWADPACIKPLEEAWTAIDAILDRNDTQATAELKALFGLQDVPTWRFAALGADIATAWQSRSWNSPVDTWDDTICRRMQKRNDNVTIGGVSYTGAIVTFKDTMSFDGLCPNGTMGQACLDAFGDVFSLSVAPDLEVPPKQGITRSWEYRESSCEEGADDRKL